VNRKNLSLLLLIGSILISGCYYYGPYPGPYYAAAPGPYAPYSSYASYDYILDSAARAAQDVGIQITSTNRNAGTIFGQRDGTDVTIHVIRQSDGRTRVELTAKGNQGSAIASDFYRAYDAYMGRK